MEYRSLNIALIGCGRAGMIHAENFAARIPGARMAAVTDINPEAAKAASRKLGLERWYTDYRDMLQNETIDGVVVVSPTHLHREIVVACAQHKKHVLCEKPMAMTVGECQAMIDACAENNVKLQIGFMRRHDRSFKQAKEMLNSGAIGDLVQIHSLTRGPSKPRPWMYDLKASNGILAEVNSHDIDAARWFAGSEFETLYAVGGNYRNLEIAREYPDYYDSVLMSGTFQNGVQFVIDGAAYVQYGYDARMELVGTKGVLNVGRSEADFLRVTTPGTGTASPFIQSWMTLFSDAYREEDADFVQAILTDRDPAVTGMDGLMAVQAVQAGNRSISTKEVITL